MKKRLASFHYALKGLADVCSTQPNMRIHLLAAVAVTALGIFLGMSGEEWCILTLTIALVFIAEAFNTALEYVTDLASPQIQPLAGKAKDAAAGAVFLAALASVGVGGVLFIPKILLLLNT